MCSLNKREWVEKSLTWPNSSVMSSEFHRNPGPFHIWNQSHQTLSCLAQNTFFLIYKHICRHWVVYRFRQNIDLDYEIHHECAIWMRYLAEIQWKGISLIKISPLTGVLFLSCEVFLNIFPFIFFSSKSPPISAYELREWFIVLTLFAQLTYVKVLHWIVRLYYYCCLVNDGKCLILVIQKFYPSICLPNLFYGMIYYLSLYCM